MRSAGGEDLPGYAFGWWIARPSFHPESRGPVLADQGAFGCTPWIDLDLGDAPLTRDASWFPAKRGRA